MSMTLKQFAILGGVEVCRCDKSWGGTWSYRTSDRPNSEICGYRNESSLYKSWADDTFGKTAAKAIIKLLDDKAKAK